MDPQDVRQADRSGETDASERAASIISGNIRSIIEVALTRAADIEREAQHEAQEIRDEAHASADRVLKRIDSVEDRLGSLASSLREEVTNASQHDDSGLGLTSRGGDAGAAPIDPGAESGDGQNFEDEPDRAPEQPASADPDRETVNAPPEAELRATPDHTSGGGAEDLRGEAQTRVIGTSDVELADLHDIAAGRSASAPEGEREYWTVLMEATVTEAVARSGFGESGPETGSASRRESKRRKRQLRGLQSARSAVLAGSDEQPATED